SCLFSSSVVLPSAPSAPLWFVPLVLPFPGGLFGEVAVELGDELLLVGAGVAAVEEAGAGLAVEALPAGLLVAGGDRVESRPRAPPRRRLQVAGRFADHQHPVGPVAVSGGALQDLLFAADLLTADDRDVAVQVVLGPLLLQRLLRRRRTDDQVRHAGQSLQAG